MNKFTMLFALIIAPISLNSMALDNPCPGKICADQIVLDSNNRIITVDQFSPTVNERADGIKIGTIVIDEDNRVGEVFNVFKDDRVLYSLDGFLHVSKNVQPEILINKDEIKRGLKIVDRNSNIGEVLHVFADGRVSYHVDRTRSYDYFVSTYVSPEVLERKDGVKQGSFVLDEKSRIVRVLNVFKDNRVSYYLPYSDMSELTSDLTSDVAVSRFVIPEVNEHRKYSKGVEYATKDFKIGTIERFFKDGRVLMYSLGGNPSLEESLFSEVPNLSEYKKGLSVMTSSSVGATILKVFENGTVKVEIDEGFARNGVYDPRYAINKHTISSKIYASDESKVENDNYLWSKELTFQQVPGYKECMSKLVINKSKFSELNEKIKMENSPIDLSEENKDLDF